MAQTFTVKTVIAWRVDALAEFAQTYCACVSSLMAYVCYLRQSTKFEIIAKTANSKE